MIALLGGEIDMMVAQIPSSKQLHVAGKVRALAVSGAKRSAAMADIPTMIESGVAGFEATSWYCVVAPAGTPKAIVDRLNTEIVRALNTPEMRQRLADDGAEVEPSTPAELARFVHSEIAKWARAVKDSGARID
jgi:tripartite-type tricarboxylate transporter receptor subunit TctC